MGKFALLLVLLVVTLLGAPVALLYSAIQATPRVPERSAMAYGDVGRIKALLRQHDPRGLRDGQIHSAQVSEQDLNLLLNTALPHADRVAWQLALLEGQAQLHTSVSLPPNPLGQYLNVSLLLEQDGDALAVRRLELGNAALPGWVLAPLVLSTQHYLRRQYRQYDELMSALRSVEVKPRSLQVAYQWQSSLVDKLQEAGRDALLSDDARRATQAYYREIARVSRSLSGARVSLDRLLQPLFELSAQRSANGNDPRAENRWLLLSLGAAVSGSSARLLVAGDTAPPDIAPMRLTLRGREDLAKHFALSAALAAAGGDRLADTIGVFKEVDDSQGGSGFSFADLLADRAGVALAEAAMGPDARALQDFLRAGNGEAAYMPGFTSLPEGLAELQFKARYEDLNSATYALIDSEIERRISGVAIHRSGVDGP